MQKGGRGQCLEKSINFLIVVIVIIIIIIIIPFKYCVRDELIVKVIMRIKIIPFKYCVLMS
jgi:hypothetical protein